MFSVASSDNRQNFIRFPAVQKLWTSVNIWQSYRQLQGGNFFWDSVNAKNYLNDRTYSESVPGMLTVLTWNAEPSCNKQHLSVTDNHDTRL